MPRCMEHAPEMLLPETIRAAACRSDNEWGWPPELIPLVIDEAEKLGLLNIGGQLQFLLPEGICECYWVEVDTLAAEPQGLTWPERVASAANTARQQMADISRRYDFIEEGRKAFLEHFTAYEAAGGDLRNRMCFIWYLEADQTAIV
jgi:hypothetical protein